MNAARISTKGAAAFTIVELTTATAVIAIILFVLVQLTGQTTATWQYTTGKAEQFRQARNGFETMARRISQATLNTYWDYRTDSNGIPVHYVRTSELRFASGPMQAGKYRLDQRNSPARPTHGVFFHAPFGHVSPEMSGTDWEQFRGLDGLINTWGYYIEVNDDFDSLPPFLQTENAPVRIRSRLMEMMQPSGGMLATYAYTSGASSKDYKGLEWLRTPLAFRSGENTDTGLAHPLAENIIALILLPKLSTQDADGLGLDNDRQNTALAPAYFYHSGDIGEAAGKNGLLAAGLNSKHQLPPVVQVTMVAIDEVSAQRMNLRSPADDPLRLQSSELFVKAENYDGDLLYRGEAGDSLEKRLIDAGLNYRIFTTNVLLRGAKWSTEQTR